MNGYICGYFIHLPQKQHWELKKRKKKKRGCKKLLPDCVNHQLMVWGRRQKSSECKERSSAEINSEELPEGEIVQRSNIPFQQCMFKEMSGGKGLLVGRCRDKRE